MSDLPNVVKLSKPLVAIDRSFSELALREPNGEDLSAAGYPVRFLAKAAGETVTEFDAPAMTRMIARLAGIPLASANALGMRDWNRCAQVIAGFLGDGAAESA